MKIKCDYCGFVTEQYNFKAGDSCFKCKKGIFCAEGTIGWGK